MGWYKRKNATSLILTPLGQGNFHLIIFREGGGGVKKM